MIKSPFPDHFNCIRNIFLVETAPNSDKYFQIMLNQEQKLAMLDLLQSFMPKDDDGGFTVPVMDDEYELPELKDHFPQKEIDTVE